MDEASIQLKRRENEEQATSMRAKILGFIYLDTRKFENDIELVKDVLPLSIMREEFIIPLQRGNEEEHFEFMITSQTPSSTIKRLRTEYNDNGYRVDFFLISLSAYKIFMLRHDPPAVVEYDDIKISTEGDSSTLDSVSATLNSVSSDKIFDFLIEQASKLGASDIHIENLRSEIRIRMRIDGILHPVAKLEKNRYRILISELSSRANISTASNRPQSGHIQKEIQQTDGSHLVNIRVEAIPTMYGQDAVLRLFNFNENLLNLDLLGITKEERQAIDQIISHPRGLVLMVGPTGSGKSTTLYSILNALNSTSRKIITLEDPIEYGMSGLTQIPVDTTKGGSFAENLRSVLRLDPDVVMVGEIRDIDTAKTAIQASITGHLVLSSFHANTAAAAFARIIDMIGVNPIFAHSIRLVIAQRLVRKLAPSKESYQPDVSTLNYIRQTLSGVPDINLDKITLYRPVITSEFPFGYSGRMAIMEQLVVNDEISAFLSGTSQFVDTKSIEKTAITSGMLTLEQKGIIAALKGETTLEEISRVV